MKPELFNEFEENQGIKSKMILLKLNQYILKTVYYSQSVSELLLRKVFTLGKEQSMNPVHDTLEGNQL